MRAFYTDHFVLPLPETHRFPMDKYRLLRQSLVEQQILSRGDLSVPDGATDEDLLRVHTPDYVRRVLAGELTDSELRRIGFPWSPELVERSRRSAGATLQACRAALEAGTAANLAGGTHHAFADHGEGFCVFNDAAIASSALLAEGAVGQVLIADCDVHQGNGTASIFRGESRVFTFSIHGASNYPYRKEESDLDVPLPDGTGDHEYLEALDRGLDESLSRAEPDLTIYVSGADPYHRDRFGRLSLSREGLKERDRRVFAAHRERGVPVAVVMAGGYAPEIDRIVTIHLATVREAARNARGPVAPELPPSAALG